LTKEKITIETFIERYKTEIMEAHPDRPATPTQYRKFSEGLTKEEFIATWDASDDLQKTCFCCTVFSESFQILDDPDFFLKNMDLLTVIQEYSEKLALIVANNLQERRSFVENFIKQKGYEIQLDRKKKENFHTLMNALGSVG
jgi:hypothetical protein